MKRARFRFRSAPLGLFLLACMPCMGAAMDQAQIEASLAFTEKQLAVLVANVGDADEHPRTLDIEGRLRLAPPAEWTSGFYPGCLWLMYEHTGEAEWRRRAERATAAVEQQQHNASTHDLGFMIGCSFGNGYRLTGKPAFARVLTRSAETLASRFNPKVGCIRSWDWGEWAYPVIIDNMMNLELLFWASKATGDPRFREIAMSHASTTLKNHFREQGGAFHVLSYDPGSGRVLEKTTHQGHSDGSAWARGQSWGLYGFTMSYRETKQKAFLETAVRLADFLLGHERLPDDGIPYWDFDAPDIPKSPRDVSAGAIMCSALLELADFPGVDSERYRAAADRILVSLSAPPYRAARVGDNQGFLLAHSVGNLPGDSEIDVPLIYADYYYLEALLRRLKGVTQVRPRDQR